MHVAYTGRRPQEDAPFPIIDGLTALVLQSDILVVAAPETPETRGIVDAKVLEALESVDIQDSDSAVNVIQTPCSRGVLNDWGSPNIKRSSVGADGASFAGQEQRSRQDRCG
jgi:phosphoglycerate dehydrogenase-like enzyme